MKILFIGDITSRIGRRAVSKILPSLRDELKVDLVIANGENSATRVGMTEKAYRELTRSGIDFFTSGNHIWRKKEFIPNLDDKNYKVIRPENYPPGTPGRGYDIIEVGKEKVAILNFLGLTNMDPELENPFRRAEGIIRKVKGAKIKIVDFHAEITSEKVAFGLFLDGKVSAVLGTHTHVPTADARVTENGTALVTDVGMTGPEDSVLGVEKDIIIDRFINALPRKFEVPEHGMCVFNSVLLDIDKKGKTKSIKRIDRKVEV